MTTITQLTFLDAPLAPGRLQRRIPDRTPDGAGGWLWYVPGSSKGGAEPRYERNAALLAELSAVAPPKPQLKLGWEIMLDRPGCDLTAPELSLGGARAVLVEFPRAYLPVGTTDELDRIRRSGVVPVVAHPERYYGCTLDTVRGWRDAGAVIQTDATMLLARGPMTELAKSLLAAGLVDCLASDNHGDRRSLAAARVWLEEMGAEEHAHILTHSNAARVLGNEPPIPVPPLPLGRGMLQRLRELWFGRR